MLQWVKLIIVTAADIFASLFAHGKNSNKGMSGWDL